MSVEMRIEILKKVFKVWISHYKERQSELAQNRPGFLRGQQRVDFFGIHLHEGVAFLQ